MTTFDMFESSVASHTHFYNLDLLFYQFKVIEIKFMLFLFAVKTQLKAPHAHLTKKILTRYFSGNELTSGFLGTAC